MIRGISLEIPNQKGNILSKVLQPINITEFNWSIGHGESYLVVDGQLDEDFFSQDVKIMDGKLLKKNIEDNQYYVIFADLKAFPKSENVTNIETYEDYIKSECQLIILVVDCSYTTIYCKDKENLDRLYQNAKDSGFKNVQYITDENDTMTSLTAW